MYLDISMRKYTRKYMDKEGLAGPRANTGQHPPRSDFGARDNY